MTYPSVVDSADPLPWADLAAAGYAGGIRYVSAYGWKNITPAEAALAARYGRSLGLVYEDDQDSFVGAQAGLRRAQIARPLLADLAWPAGRPVYAAVDEQLAPSGYAETWLGIQAFANALGRPPAVYAGRQYLCWLADTHGVKFLWESAGWKIGPSAAGTSMAQQGQLQISGVTVDLDVVYAEDWGQHPAPQVSPPTDPPPKKPQPQQEEDVKTFVAVATSSTKATKEYPAVDKGSCWVVAFPFCRSWLATTATVNTVCKQLGQTAPEPLDPNTLCRLPIVGRSLAGAER